MRYIKITTLFIALLIVFNSCQKELLNKIPLDKVSSAVFFNQPSDMEIYMNQFYTDKIFPVKYGSILGNPYDRSRDDFNSDNQVSAYEIDTRLKGDRTIQDASSGWNFADVRSINHFFDNYKKCPAPFADYQQYVGEAHFFRALIYFKLLNKFGDVPWVATELQTNSPELYGIRTPRNIVADNIISDLDSAAMYLTDKRNDGASRIYKGAALLLQTRVALYEGTWEKYHAGDPFGVDGSQPEKYFNKVVEAATTMMNSGLFQVYKTGNPSSDYYDLFKIRDYTPITEVLFWKKFSTALGINNQRNYKLETPFGYSITKGLADAYLCTDGKPIAGNALFLGYNTITQEIKNRDPRFSQTIFTPADTWKTTGSDVQYWNEVYTGLNSTSNYYAPTGYVQRKEYDPLMMYHSTNFEETPVIHFRYAEVLLNFAEAKAELGTLTQDDLDHSIGLLRARAGMPGIILGSIANDPDWDFPTLSPIINEVRRERRVELSLEGFRWPDIARWAAADELIVGKRPKGFKASQISGSAFPNDADGFLDPFQTALPTGYQFKINRDYLDAIPLNQMVLNPQLTQNPGWE
jgi:hypothetical protein